MSTSTDDRPEPILYKIGSAAKAIDVSYKTMQRMVEKRLIRYRLVNLGTPGTLQKRIHRDDIDEWIGKGSVKPPI